MSGDLGACARFHRLEEHARVQHAVQSAIKRIARGPQVERCAHRGGARDAGAGRRALLAEPFQQHVAAKGDADHPQPPGNGMQTAQDPVELLAV
ncbi:MAG: hypothetical protein P8Y76_02040, partial [bacterium]